MPQVYDDFEQPVARARGHEFSSRSTSRSHDSRNVRRMVFFGIAGLWGFITGVAAVLAPMSVTDQPLASRGGILLALIPCALIAIVGGFVVAAAYKESKRRA